MSDNPRPDAIADVCYVPPLSPRSRARAQAAWDCDHSGLSERDVTRREFEELKRRVEQLEAKTKNNETK